MKRICIPVTDESSYQNYFNALTHLNVQPVFVHEITSPDEFDGLLLPGGDDVNPKRYNKENIACGEIDDELDELQFSTLDQFVKANKPVLGICRGHQLLNVYFKGTLIQDIKEKDHHKWLEPHGDNINTIITEENTFLNEIYGKTFISNSSHHQAVDTVGEGLIISARADDRIIEAMQHSTLPIWSVQFHPERMCFEKTNPKTADGSKVLEYFLNKL